MRLRRLQWIASRALLVIGPLGVFSSSQDFPVFVDVAGTSGLDVINVSGSRTKEYILEIEGNGAAFFDYDRDGDTDLLITNGSTLDRLPGGGDPLAVLYRNDAGLFRDRTREAGLDRTGWGMGACVADYDNDGLSDVYVTAYGPNVLYRNLGNGSFEDVTSTAGVGEGRWSTNCAFGDYDLDGDVDLYVANYVKFDERIIPSRGPSANCRYMGAHVACGPRGLDAEPDILYRNEGDGTFTDVTEAAGVAGPEEPGFGVVFSDLDNDGWPEIYVANDSQANLLFRNNGNGTFREVGLLSGTALNEKGALQAGMGIGVGDYDGDGLFDLFVTNFAYDTNTLYRNMGNLFFVDATEPAGLGAVSRPHLGWGTGFADLDNDGFEDIFVANGHTFPQVDELDVNQSYLQRKEVYRNLGSGRFEELALELGSDLGLEKAARGSAFADYDDDGDIDILAVHLDERPSLYRNDGGNRNNWISLRLEGTRSNRDAIGARIEADLGDRVLVAEVRSGGSYLSHSDMRIHFGLGQRTGVEGIRIRWPGGDTEDLGRIEANRFLTVREGAGVVGSAGGTER